MALTIQEAVDYIQMRHGGGPYNARYSHSDELGNYVIQVSEYVIDHTVTDDWYTVNPVNHTYTSMVHGYSGLIPFSTKQQEYIENTQMANGYSNYGGGYGKANVARTVDNVVVLQGLVKKATPFNFNEIVLTLPEIYRPKQQLIFWQQSNTGAVRVDVSTNGEIRVLSGGYDWISLAGITYNLDLGI